MKYFVIFIIIASIVLVVPNQAFALSCGIPPFEETYKRHDLLLHGKLIEKNTPPAVIKTTTLVFETINVYKGEYQDKFTVKADLSWDDYYREGEEYVLFADKEEDHYYRDLCVSDYIAAKGIIEFLDDYVEGKTTSNNVFRLYDLVSSFEMKQLESKMNLYSQINRGNDFLNNLMNEKVEHDFSCDFEKDLKQAEKLFAENVYVFNKLRDNNSDYTITTDATLSTNPQTGLVVIESQEHKAIISILNSPHFENCFFVYGQQLIEKTTGELDVHRNSLETMCSADNATVILPDLCKSQTMTELINPVGDLESQGILYVIILLAIFGGMAFGLVIYRRRK